MQSLEAQTRQLVVLALVLVRLCLLGQLVPPQCHERGCWWVAGGGGVVLPQVLLLVLLRPTGACAGMLLVACSPLARWPVQPGPATC